MNELLPVSPKLLFGEARAPADGVLEWRLGFGVTTPPFQMSRDVVDAGRATVIDRHPEHEIWYIAEGEGEILYDGIACRAQQGDLFYFPPLKQHQIINNGANPLVLLAIWWQE